ncbi:hypothetical protein BT69DRAFT_1324496 [Atractiella rhizophila]|nr:hypothetical protein BT69DRAFT_1324496 [Atractiella rhizophila]
MPLPPSLSRLAQSLQSLPKQIPNQAEVLKVLYSKKASWDEKIGVVSRNVSELTGYGGIERLKGEVGEREKALSSLRALSTASKKAHELAVAKRAASHAEVNDLLQRKTVQGWGEGEVERFTLLVRKDHDNELEEKRTKEEMDRREEATEKAFSDLMQSILNRYHEEQIWSDKIRTISSYGSMGITALNIILFIAAILIVEPWKRRKMVDRFEERLEEREHIARDHLRVKFEEMLEKLNWTEEKVDLLLKRVLGEEPLAKDSTLSGEPILVPLLESGPLEEAAEAPTAPSADVPILPIGVETPTMSRETEKIQQEEEERAQSDYDRFMRVVVVTAASAVTGALLISIGEFFFGG